MPQFCFDVRYISCISDGTLWVSSETHLYRWKPPNKDDPEILNSFFSVEYYNGGKENPGYEVENILQTSLRPPHCSGPGENFDLVLRFDHEECDRFTLTHFEIVGGVRCTAPIREG